jgi:hypothetical protein
LEAGLLLFRDKKTVRIVKNSKGLKMRTTAENIIDSKIKNLPSDIRREVFDFIEFLMAKRTSKKGQKAIKDKLLSVSVWSKKDLLIFEEIGKDINKWNIAKY